MSILSFSPVLHAGIVWTGMCQPSRDENVACSSCCGALQPKSYEFQQRDAQGVLNLLANSPSKAAWSIEKTRRGSRCCTTHTVDVSRSSENREKTLVACIRGRFAGKRLQRSAKLFIENVLTYVESFCDLRFVYIIKTHWPKARWQHRALECLPVAWALYSLSLLPWA